MTHSIPCVRPNLVGSFSPDYPPILSINSGDEIISQTADAGWGELVNPDPFAEAPKMEREGKRDQGHALIGPIAVEGAEPGDAIEVEILELRPGAYGWGAAAGWPSEVHAALDLEKEPHFPLRMSIDADAGTASTQDGRTVALQPFLGVIGLTPNIPGWSSTVPPRRVGGNIDCKLLIAGSRLLLPVEVPGGLLMFGDGHGVQGNGEVSGIALECPMEKVRLRVSLRKGAAPSWPRAVDASSYIAFGFDPDLNKASLIALENMVDWLTSLSTLSRSEALAFASLIVDLDVTQIVNQTKGIHARVQTTALSGLGIGHAIDPFQTIK